MLPVASVLIAVATIMAALVVLTLTVRAVALQVLSQFSRAGPARRWWQLAGRR